MEIQKAEIADLAAVTNLVSEVSVHDVLPLFSEQGKLEFDVPYTAFPKLKN